jgi:hypothetical protein
MATQIIRIFLTGSPQISGPEPLSAPTEHSHSPYQLPQLALGGRPAKPVSYQLSSSVQLDGSPRISNSGLNKRDSCCSRTRDPQITETTGPSWSTSRSEPHHGHESSENRSCRISDVVGPLHQWLGYQYLRDAPNLQSAPVQNCRMDQTSPVDSVHGSLIDDSRAEAGSTMSAPKTSKRRPSSIYDRSNATPTSQGAKVPWNLIEENLGLPIREEVIATLNDLEQPPETPADAESGLLPVGRKETHSRSLKNQKEGDPMSTTSINQGVEVARSFPLVNPGQGRPIHVLNIWKRNETPTITFMLAGEKDTLVLVSRQKSLLESFMENQTEGDPSSKFSYSSTGVHPDGKNSRPIMWSGYPEHQEGRSLWLNKAVGYVDVILVESEKKFLAESSIRIDG